MKILQLHLDAFGPFTDMRFDFSDGDYGLHIVYGDNEAGKSSTLRAVHAMLFGFPKQTPDNFLHGNKKLRVGATLANDAGETIRFVRRKGTKSTLLDPNQAQGSAHSDDALAPFLGNLNQDSFSSIFGIDHDRMRAGGEALQQLQGLVGESLFAASVGGATLTSLMDQLQDEATEIYQPKKRTQTLMVLKNKHREFTKRRAEMQVRVSRWDSLRKELNKAEEERTKADTALTQLRMTREKLQRWKSALPVLNDHRRLTEALEPIRLTPILPAEYNVSDRIKVEQELAMLRVDAAAIADSIRGPDGLNAQLESLDVPEPLLREKSEVARLVRESGAIDKAREDVKRRVHERLERMGTARRLLRDLAPELPFEEAHTLRISPEVASGIRALANHESLRRSSVAEHRAQRKEMEAKLAAATTELQSIGEPVAVLPLARLLDDLPSAAQVELSQREVNEQYQQCEADFLQHLQALPLWQGTPADFAQFTLPLPATIDELEEQIAELASARRQLQAKSMEGQSELESTGADIQRLLSNGHIPTHEELLHARQARDAVWQQLRSHFLDGSDGESDVTATSLLDPFEQLQNAADEVADQLRRNADRVAQLAERQVDKARLEKQQQRFEQQAVALGQRQHEWNQRWQALWTGIRISDPLSPREMRNWLHQVEVVRTAQRQYELASLARDKANHRSSEIERSLRQQFSILAFDAVGRTPAELIREARTILADQEQMASRRHELQRDMDRMSQSVESLGQLYEEAKIQLDEWKERWAAAMQQIGCPADAPAEQANKRLECLDQLSDCIDEIESLDRRIAAIHQDAKEFEHRVRTLAETVHLDCPDAKPTTMVEMLEERLDLGHQYQARRTQLQQSLLEKNAELRDTNARIEKLETRMRRFCEMAQVDDVAQLGHVEQASKQAQALHTRREEVNQQLSELSLDGNLESLQFEIGEKDADQLAADIDSLGDQIASTESGRDEIVAKIRELENECRNIDGNAASAEADQESLGIISQMHEEFNQFARLRLALAMLKRRIEQHRRDNQDPMLERASHLFAAMTCGAFQGLRIEYGADDQPRIEGIRDAKESLAIAAMSDGTRDQLFLALRLAYLERRLQTHEKMPLIVDDILIHFDDQRSVATLKQLIELSIQTQVIIFTHHRHLVDVAHESLPADQLFLHRLDPRVSETSTLAATIPSHRTGMP